MIHIITDSMSDVRQEEAARENITVLPQPVLFGQDTYMDGVTLTPPQFYQRLAQSTALPKTSQVSPEAFAEAFQAALDAGQEVLCITGSSKLSGSYQGAVLARSLTQQPQRIFIVDSLNASLGQQLLVWKALRLREAGLSAQEAASQLEALVGRISVVGHTSNLKHLVMGGRLTAAKARIGTTLNLKPTLRLSGGRLGQESLTRGARRANEWVLAQMRAQPADPNYPVCIASSGAPEQLAVLRAVLEQGGMLEGEVRQVDIGAIIGTHTGPGVLAAAWVQAEA